MDRRRGISSIYGFIMIFLLSMASIQTWSSAVGSMSNIQSAADESHQVQQLQALEHLSLSLSRGNLTITNNGQVPSTLEFLRLVGANSSRTIQLDEPISVGDSVQQRLSGDYTIEAVTLLGNVFTLAPAAGTAGAIWSGAGFAGPSRNNQVFDNPYNSTVFYLGSGSKALAFSDSGAQLWSFDAGTGVVTDVMPISGGDVYVSVGYSYPSNAGQLFELGPGGSVITSFSVRTLDLPVANSNLAPDAVSMGVDSSYVYYDGWFYSSSGAQSSLSLEDTPLAATDGSDFYFLTSLGGSTYGSCEPWGNEMTISSSTPGSNYSGGFNLNWQNDAYLGPCTRYDPQFVAATANDGTFAAAFAAPYYSDSTLQALPGYNPYLVVESSSGLLQYDKELPSNGYSGIATDGPEVYLAMPAVDKLQALSISTQTITTYAIGIPASQLICDYGYLFAVSQSVVKVYDGSMNLVQTIDLSPSGLASFSNGFSSQPALQSPSFLPLNATTYAALLVNGTGYASLVIGSYS